MNYVNGNPLQWKNKDFYLSSIVRASGASLIGIEKGAERFMLFVFDITPEKAEKIISDHWSKALRLPTRDVIEAINELRTRLKNGI